MLENNILIDFEIAIDLDFGLIKAFKKYMKKNNEIIKWKLLNSISDDILVQLLTERNDENPLTIILNKDYISQADKLYKQAIDSLYDDILALSRPTSLLNLINVYEKTDLIGVTVLCKNTQQQQFIKKFSKADKVLIDEDFSKIDIDEFDSIYLKYFKDTLLFKKLIGKSLYIANYKFNLADDLILPKKEIKEKLNNALKINIIDVYSKENFIKIEG